MAETNIHPGDWIRYLNYDGQLTIKQVEYLEEEKCLLDNGTFVGKNRVLEVRHRPLFEDTPGKYRAGTIHPVPEGQSARDICGTCGGIGKVVSDLDPRFLHPCPTCKGTGNSTSSPT